jgi:histidinol-phosphate aminotransferase
VKNWLNKVQRIEGSDFDRTSFLRLDKNERVIKFEKKFINYLKENINLYNISSYPNVFKVKKLISKKNNVSQEMIFLSAGSDLALKTCIELFTKTRDKVIILEPTFGMIDDYIKLYNLNAIKIGYDQNLKLDTSFLLKKISKEISMIILANPNSPTGTIIEKKIMIKILNNCKKLNIPIVIDEAYDGFFKFSYVNLIRKFPNLIITKTFSKSYGLAGLRLGYAISNKKISNLLNKFRPMYEINSIACLAAEFFLKNINYEKQHIKEIDKSKNYLKKELTKMKIDYLDTYANFFHIKLGKKIKYLEQYFKRNKILFRKGPGVKGFEEYARFSVGSVLQMKKVIRLIKNINERNPYISRKSFKR